MPKRVEIYNPYQQRIDFDNNSVRTNIIEVEKIEPEQAQNVLVALELACKASKKKALIGAAESKHPGVNNKYYRTGAVEYQKSSRKEILGEYKETIKLSLGSQALRMAMAESNLDPNLPQDEYGRALPKAFYFEYTGAQNEEKRRKLRKELKKYIKKVDE